MNINKKNLEILLITLIGANVDKEIKGKAKNYTELITWGELLIDLDTDKRLIDIHFKYYTYYKSGFFLDDKDDETIEFCLSNKTRKTRENLQEIQDKTYVDKNALYTIISILEEM